MDNLTLMLGQIAFTLNGFQQLNQPVNATCFILKHYGAAHNKAEIQ